MDKNSRIITKSIQANLETIFDNTFLPINIKSLLVDLREFGKELRKNTKERPKSSLSSNLISMLDQFLDICDFIAHHKRDRGFSENNIRKQINNVFNFNNGKIGKVDYVMTEKSIIGALLILICHYLESNSQVLDLGEIEKNINEKSSDIMLCMISLLQDTVVELKKNEGLATLHILAIEGKYRLYCRIRNTKIEKEAKERMKVSINYGSKVILGFPIIVTDCLCIDNLDINYSDNLQLPILEPYREIDGKLHMKII